MADKVEQNEAAEPVGDTNASGSGYDCAICQETDLLEVGELDCCDHCFCVNCILEWAKVVNTCPLCKQRFWKVKHKQLDLEALPPADNDVVADKFPGVVLREYDIEEREQRPEAPVFEDPLETLACMECGGVQDEDLILLCDSCNQGCHTYCATPPLDRIPAGDWFCSVCSPTLGAAVSNRQRSHSGSTPRSTRAAAATRAPRRRRLQTQVAHDSDDSYSGGDEDFTTDDLIEQAALAISSGVGRVPRTRSRASRAAMPLSHPRRRPSNPRQMPNNRPSRLARTAGGAARTRRLVRHALAAAAAEDDSADDSAAPARRLASQAPTHAHRSVENLRTNWAAIRRGEASFQSQPQAGSDDLDDLPLAERMARTLARGHAQKRVASDDDADDDVPLSIRMKHKKAREVLQRTKRRRDMQVAGNNARPQPAFSVSSYLQNRLVGERSRQPETQPRSAARGVGVAPHGRAESSSRQAGASKTLLEQQPSSRPSEDEPGVWNGISGDTLPSTEDSRRAQQPASQGVVTHPEQNDARGSIRFRGREPQQPVEKPAEPWGIPGREALARPPGQLGHSAWGTDDQLSMAVDCTTDSPALDESAEGLAGHDREGLKARKHAAGKAIKEQLDPWWRSGSINAEQFKSIAKAATRALYKGETAVNGPDWEHRARGAVRHAMKRLGVEP